MPLANPAAKFANLRFQTRPYERRSVCVMSASTVNDHRNVVTTCSGGLHTHFTRAKVVAMVESGEMRWLDRHHNTATYTTVAAGTWQKCQSGPVATMQLRQGAKGRYVPVAQREPELEMVL